MSESEEPGTFAKDTLIAAPKWARVALAALSVAGLIGLLAASGCINGETIEAPTPIHGGRLYGAAPSSGSEPESCRSRCR